MYPRYAVKFVLSCLALGLAGCAGSSGVLTGTPEQSDASVIAPVVPGTRLELPGLGTLPASAGLSVRAARSVSHQLLGHAPVATSGAASAVYQGGGLSLRPSLNGGLAWAVFELFDFPDDGSLQPGSITVGADGQFYLGVSNYTAKHWHFEKTGPTGTLSLGSGLKFHSARGSMYVVAVATGQGDLGLTSIDVQTPTALPSDGYGEHEDNDAANTANPLPPLPLAGLKGSLGTGGYDGDTADFYSFPADEGQAVSLTLSYPAGANYSLTLYKPGGTALLSKDDQGNPGSRHVTVGLKAGTYILKVAALAGTGDHSLDASLSTPGYTEAEDNDSPAQAGILPGGTVSGSVGATSYDGDTSDYFFFQAQEGASATLTLTYPAGAANLSLALLNTAGTQLNKDSAGNTGLRSFSWGLHAGTAYVLVKAESGSADYALDLAIDDPGFQEREDNDGFPTAQALPTLPVTAFTGSCGAFGYDGDGADYYSFECSDGDIVSTSLGYDENAGNLSLTLYNADQSIAVADTAGNSGARAVNWGLRGGQCFIAVKAASGSSAYSLAVSAISPGYDESENNDTAPTADVLSSFPIVGFKGSVGAAGYDGDGTDFFTFTAVDKEQFTFTLDYDETSSNLSLDLLNAANQTIYSDVAGNSGSRSFSWGLKAGEYYLKVNASSGISDYLLDVAKAPSGLDETEDNDTRPAAQPLPALPFAAFAGHCGKFGYDGDNDDWFFFNLSGSIPFSSTLVYDSGGGTVKYFLVDGAGASVASDATGNPGTRTVAATIGPGTYYLHVQSSAGGSGYSFDTTDS
jgi:hypothetical protein